MSDTIPAAALVAMLKFAVAKIRGNVDLLTRLDTVTGDGDHGTAMLRSMDAVEKAIDEYAEAGAKEVLSKAPEKAAVSKRRADLGIQKRVEVAIAAHALRIAKESSQKLCFDLFHRHRVYQK